MFGLNVTDLILGAATLIGAFIGTRLVKPGDHQRAETLARIAAATAALVVSLQPSASWPELLKEVVNRVANAAGVPTSNMQAIERAAARALTDLGRNPGVK